MLKYYQKFTHNCGLSHKARSHLNVKGDDPVGKGMLPDGSNFITYEEDELIIGVSNLHSLAQ